MIQAQAGAGPIIEFAHSINSVYTGFTFMRTFRDPQLDETLISRQEVRHPEDRCAVAVIKLWDGNKHLMVGHVPKEISRTC